jgi:hypothetical protein
MLPRGAGPRAIAFSGGEARGGEVRAASSAGTETPRGPHIGALGVRWSVAEIGLTLPYRGIVALVLDNDGVFRRFSGGLFALRRAACVITCLRTNDWNSKSDSID